MRIAVSRTLSSLSAAAVLAGAMAVSPLMAQDASRPGTFEPRSGQAGKDVVWVPTPQALVDRMLDMGKLTKDDLVIDLGSGDGRTVITAAKRGARAHGIEFNPDMVALSRRNAEREGVSDRATFVEGDIFKSDFSKATLITLFLLPDLNARLRPTLLAMKPGTRVVSNSFSMGDWEADASTDAGAGCTSWCRAFLWIIPARVEGDWRLGDGTLQLKQTYQMLEGTLTRNGRSEPISDGRLAGDRISFKAAGTSWSGQVDGNTIAGQRQNGGSWQARR